MTAALDTPPASIQPPPPPLRHRLFPLDERPRPSLLALLWTIPAVVAGMLVSLGHEDRTVNVLDSIWAEDGTYFLSDAFGRSFLDTVLRPLAGYFVVGPRLLAEVASLFPVQWAPAVLNVEAALVTALMALAVYVASGAYLLVPARLVVAVPVVAVPVAANLAATASNNVATLQFPALYMALWLLLWVPARRAAAVTTVAVVLMVALSTFLSALLLPFALLRLYVRRDGTSFALAGSLAFGAALNVAALALHLTARPDIGLVPRYEPVWALRSASTYGLRYAMFGYRPVVSVAVAWLLLVIVLLVGVLRLTRPAWWLAAVFGVHAVGLFCAAVMSLGALELRYVVAPELMLFAALVAVLGPRWPGWVAVTPLASLAALVALACLASYQMTTSRSGSASWHDMVARARPVCADRANGAVYVYPVWDAKIEPVPAGRSMPGQPPIGWPVRIPCHRLR